MQIPSEREIAAQQNTWNIRTQTRPFQARKWVSALCRPLEVQHNYRRKSRQERERKKLQLR